MTIDWRHIWQRMTGDKRKLGVMVGLLCVAMLLWGRLLLKDVPRSAVADPSTSQASAAGPDKKPAEATGTPQNRLADRRVVQVNLYEQVTRDPFAFDPTRFPRIGDEDQTAAVRTKLVEEPTDDEQQRQSHKAIELAARRLNLESTLLGAQSRAMINGQLLSVGESIQGFELIEVRSRQVTVRKDNVEVVLEM